MRRHWDFANIKRTVEYDRCRVCGESPSELAHTIGRRFDDRLANGDYQVNPASVVLLCSRHHGEFDRHEIDILGYLNRDEEIDAVARVGIERAYRRLAPSLFATETTTEAAL